MSFTSTIRTRNVQLLTRLKTATINPRTFSAVTRTPTLQRHFLPTQRFAINPITHPTTRHFTMSTEKKGVHNLMSKQDWDDALGAKGLLVVDAFATWCGPCKVIAPTVVKYSDQFPSTRFYKLDVDEVPDVAQELGVRAMPTFLLFKDGDKVGEVVGANAKALLAAIEKHNVSDAAETDATPAEPAAPAAVEGAPEKKDDAVAA